jgi:hypothetical protein
MRIPRPLPVFAALAVLLAMPATSHAAIATLGAVDCDAGGAVATLTNDSSGPLRYTILRDDRAIATVIVPAGPPVTRIVPIAEGAAAQVTVRAGNSYVSGLVRRSCAAGSTNVTTTASSAVAGASDAPFVASPVIPGTGVRGADQAAAETTKPAASDEVTLRDVATTWPLLAIAGIALLLAGVLAAGRVRRRTPELEEQPAPAAPPIA